MDTETTRGTNHSGGSALQESQQTKAKEPMATDIEATDIEATDIEATDIDDAGTPADDPETPHHHGYIGDKDRYLSRMKRIEGQARGIAKMIDEEKYCIDILTQVSALTRALQGVATGLLEDHLSHCVVDAARLSDEAAQEKIKEATEAINRLVRS